ncbi:helix-turn-helix domain-containing protein [Streptomyces sp. NPDC039028]|uniref:helix-turn-helix domain-containing protein n=1 Tax=unclassified Streptomyces TaxID=2593676 RepID=UPI0033DE26CB
MGRTANPVNYDVPTRGQLAELLRTEKAGTTYDELAAQTGLSAATLKRAASGNVVPSAKVIDAFLTACGSTLSTRLMAESLRRRARRDERGGYTRSIRTATINTADMLADAIEDLYRNAGAPTYREMQERAGGAYLLPLSSISRMLRRQMLPVDEKQMLAFVRGCHVPQREQAEWAEAWRRVKERSSHSPSYWANSPFDDVGQRTLDQWRIAATIASATADLNRATTRFDMPALTRAMAPILAPARKQPSMNQLAAILAPITQLSHYLRQRGDLPDITRPDPPCLVLDALTAA